MSTVKTRPTNGISYGLRHTVTADDATDGEIIFDFRAGETFYRYPLSAVVQIVNSSGVVTMPIDLAITYPSDGIVKIAGTLVATTIVNIIAQQASLVPTS